MAVTDKNSVLILGAGASVVFGMPLGGELIDLIKEQILAEISRLNSIKLNDFYRRCEDYIYRAIDHNEEIFSIPIHATVFKTYTGTENYSHFNQQERALEELLGLLSNQTSETIDDFIVENPSYSRITKICIAAVFFKKLYEKNGKNISLKPLGQRNFKKRKRVGEVGDIYSHYNERNWIHLLINIIRQGIRNEKVSPSNKVKIITFNYDMILEKVLDQQFSNSELMRGKSWVDYIEVIHPHGKCAPMLDNLDNVAETISDWASGIFVVQEHESDLPEELLEDRSKAKTYVLAAHEICAAGFSFAAPNCRLLGMQNPWGNLKYFSSEGAFDRYFRFCNYDGNYGISRAVNAFEFDGNNPNGVSQASNIIDEQPGTPDKPLNVADWIRMGVLGELPG